MKFIYLFRFEIGINSGNFNIWFLLEIRIFLSEIIYLKFGLFGKKFNNFSFQSGHPDARVGIVSAQESSS